MRDELSREQVQQIEREIEDLRLGHWDMLRRDYRKFFAHAKEIGQLFKNAKAITHSERQRLWETFNSLCDSVRQTQEREWESRVNDSRVKKEVIESNIHEAYHWAKGSKSISDLQDAERLLVKITEKMKDGWGGFTGTTELLSFSEGRLTKQDRD